jgi:hypothetical protein
MRRRNALLVTAFALGLAGCGAQDAREWMKVDRSYTKDEFQRDYRECTKKGDLDEACMRQKGWVAVNPAKSETSKQGMDPLPGRQQQRGGGRY